MYKIITFVIITFMLLTSRIGLGADITYISLENVSTGYVLTEYYDSADATEYAYPAYAYSSDAMSRRKQLYNLDYTIYNNIPAVQFKNDKTGRCLTRLLTGIASSACGMQAGNYWEMIYTSSGAVQLKNFATGECLVVANPSSSYAGLALTPCAKNGEVANSDTLWILAAPRTNATLNY